MEEKNDLIKVGKYDLRYNELLSIDIEELDIFRSKGLPAHMVKRKHYNCLKYIDYLPEIIENPDYIGINPNENDKSIEFIKKYSKNVLVGEMCLWKARFRERNGETSAILGIRCGRCTGERNETSGYLCRTRCCLLF